MTEFKSCNETPVDVSCFCDEALVDVSYPHDEAPVDASYPHVMLLLRRLCCRSVVSLIVVMKR